MKRIVSRTAFAAAMLLGFAQSRADVTYADILSVNQSVAGVRGYDASNVIFAGSYQSSGTTQGMWWMGSITSGTGTMYTLLPDLAGQTVTTTLYYGPNTAQFDPNLGPGNIRIVGSYQYEEGTPGNHGVMYTGAPAGTGTWQQIDVPSIITSGTVSNTIPHSTMGDLVVGNYNLVDVPDSGNAFLYNIAEDSWTLFNIGSMSSNTSAYGIWQNGIGSDSYTIAGGSEDEGVNRAFLINYNTTTGEFGEAVFYNDDGLGITHFEGITGTAGGYHLVGTTDNGAAFAFVPSDGETYGAISWVPLDISGSTLMTGNTVYQNIAIGVYSTSEISPNFQTYTATVPEPSSVALLAAAAGGFLLIRRRFRR